MRVLKVLNYLTKDKFSIIDVLFLSVAGLLFAKGAYLGWILVLALWSVVERVLDKSLND